MSNKYRLLMLHAIIAVRKLMHKIVATTPFLRNASQSKAGAEGGAELPTVFCSLFFAAKGLLPPISMLLIMSNIGLLWLGILMLKYISPICARASSHCVSCRLLA